MDTKLPRSNPNIPNGAGPNIANPLRSPILSSPPNSGSGYEDLPGLMALMTGDEKHSFAATSTLDVLWVLYDQVLRLDRADLKNPRRDRFLLSKGHGPMAYYAVLAAKGLLEASLLSDWATFDSPLGMHPDRLLAPGVELSSGSLGHGLPIAVGAALALRARRNPARIFVLVGDAELDEGSNAEAIALAGHYQLNALTTIVVNNHSASLAWRGQTQRQTKTQAQANEPAERTTSTDLNHQLAGRFVHEGWASSIVDGRDHRALRRALSRESLSPSQYRSPHVVVANVEAKTTS